MSEIREGLDRNGNGWRNGVLYRGGLPENPDGTPFVLDFGPTTAAERRARREQRAARRAAEEQPER